MNRNYKKLVILLVLVLFFGSSTAFGRAGLGNSFMRAFGMTPSGGGGGGTGGGGGGGGGGTGGAGLGSLTLGLNGIQGTSTQQILPTFTPYTYGRGR